MYEDIADNGLFMEFKDGVGEWSDKYIKEDMGFKTDIHLDSKLFRDNSVNLIEYIKKTREDSKKKKEDEEE